MGGSGVLDLSNTSRERARLVQTGEDDRKLGSGCGLGVLDLVFRIILPDLLVTLGRIAYHRPAFSNKSNVDS